MIFMFLSTFSNNHQSCKKLIYTHLKKKIRGVTGWDLVDCLIIMWESLYFAAVMKRKSCGFGVIRRQICLWIWKRRFGFNRASCLWQGNLWKTSKLNLFFLFQVRFRVEHVKYPPIPIEQENNAKPFAPMEISVCFGALSLSLSCDCALGNHGVLSVKQCFVLRRQYVSVNSHS